MSTSKKNIELYPITWGNTMPFQLSFGSLVTNTASNTLNTILEKIKSTPISYRLLNSYNLYSNSNLSEDETAIRKKNYLKEYSTLINKYNSHDKLLIVEYHRLNQFIFYNQASYFLPELSFLEPRIVFSYDDYIKLKGCSLEIDEMFQKKKHLWRRRTEVYNLFPETQVFALTFPVINKIFANFASDGMHIIAQDKKLLFVYSILKRLYINTTIETILVTFSKR